MACQQKKQSHFHHGRFAVFDPNCSGRGLSPYFKISWPKGRRSRNSFTGPIWDPKYVCFDGHDDIARKVPVFKVKIFIFSFERRSWEGANAEQRRRRRNSAKSRRRFNVDVLRWRHLHPHGGGEGPVVVRQPTWALHGAARQDWFRPILLW